MKAISKSLFVLSARDGDRLVGLLRIVGDAETIIYIQDILVLKEYQHRGIGSQLVQKAINKFKDVRQTVILTDDQKKTKDFYRSNGFKPAGKLNLVSFVRINNQTNKKNREDL